MSCCPSHGHYPDYLSDGCPDCRREESDREEIKDTLYEIAHRSPQSTNLGDYECPYCKQTSLKRMASRCPLCRGEIANDYWSAVAARELADAERKLAAAQAEAERRKADAERQKTLAAAAAEAAAAEQIRTAPARVAAARRALADAQRKVRNARIQIALGYGSVGALIGGIVLGFSGFNGLLFGAIIGGAIGVLIGSSVVGER